MKLENRIKRNLNLLGVGVALGHHRHDLALAELEHVLVARGEVCERAHVVVVGAAAVGLDDVRVDELLDLRRLLRRQDDPLALVRHQLQAGVLRRGDLANVLERVLFQDLVKNQPWIL